MQTFLPYANYIISARVLDTKRLGKQRVEVLQLLKTLRTGQGAWLNHPAARMWRGYENSLVAYGLAVCDEWIGRGFKDTCEEKITSYLRNEATVYPFWFGKMEFHASHRSNLLRKDPQWYGQFGWTEPPTLPYVWPV